MCSFLILAIACYASQGITNLSAVHSSNGTASVTHLGQEIFFTLMAVSHHVLQRMFRSGVLTDSFSKLALRLLAVALYLLK